MAKMKSKSGSTKKTAPKTSGVAAKNARSRDASKNGIKTANKNANKDANKDGHGAVVAKGDTFRFEYAPAPESKSIAKVKTQYELFINGKFVAPHSGRYFPSINPATGSELTQLAEADETDVDRAVKSARHAYENVWSKMDPRDRGRYLFRIARIIQERARELAVLESLDGGKPIKESRDVDIPLVAAHFFYHAGWADKLQYAFPGSQIRPLGVAAQVIPWNFPLLMAAWKIAPALATGNTVVLKPAEQTSITAMVLAEIFQEAELPPGVVNIITGAGKTGAALVAHPDVNKVAFTGSTDIGRTIARNIAGSGKKLTLELGGKSANIIFEDAAMDQAIEGIVNGIFFNQGHVCCAGSRVLVEESAHDVVVRKLKRRMEQLRVGDPLDKNTDIGAINSKEQLQKIQHLVSEGRKEGYDFYQPMVKMPGAGYFHAPCFFDNVASSSVICREEIFGPVLVVQTFRTPDEAIEKANNTPYGLAAGIWSEKGSKILKVARGLKAGVVWTNTYNKFDPTAPFGGYKESGFGREGGVQGLRAYMHVEHM